MKRAFTYKKKDFLKIKDHWKKAVLAENEKKFGMVITKIQNAWRGYRQRKIFSKIKRSQKLISRWYKAHAARKIFKKAVFIGGAISDIIEMLYKKYMVKFHGNAAICIQKWMRGYLARKHNHDIIVKAKAKK